MLRHFVFLIMLLLFYKEKLFELELLDWILLFREFNNLRFFKEEFVS